MISERAIPVRGRVASGERAWRLPSLRAAPAIAGRQRLMEALGQSVLIQLMLAMTLIAVALLLYMAQESQISVQQINLSVLRSNHMQLVADNTTLRARATALQSTPRIDRTASTRLGMSAPDNSSYMWVNVAVPPLPAVHPVNADVLAAERQSSPVAWMGRLIHTVQSSL